MGRCHTPSTEAISPDVPILTPLEPLIKWPGGKRRLLKFIMPLVPKSADRYYEPFLGSAAVFFALRPRKALLTDKNADLIAMYQQVRDNPESVIGELRKFKNTEEDYYRIRDAAPKSDAQKAARLIYLSTLSFNGIHRVNAAGLFNVPYGLKTHVIPCNVERIRAASLALKDRELQCTDFEDAVADAEKGAVIYLDPPYTTAHSNNGFVKYNAKIFTWDDQKRLARVAHSLAERGCSVIVSNADHPSIRRLYRGFKTLKIKRHSIIAASGEFRRLITECLFCNA